MTRAEYYRVYRQKHRAELSAYGKLWRQRNSVKTACYSQRRQARKCTRVIARSSVLLRRLEDREAFIELLVKEGFNNADIHREQPGSVNELVQAVRSRLHIATSFAYKEANTARLLAMSRATAQKRAEKYALRNTKIAEMRAGGTEARSIAEYFGMTLGAVRSCLARNCKQLGLSWKSELTEAANRRKAATLRLHADGNTNKEIAKVLGLSRLSIDNYTKDLKLTPNKPKRVKRSTEEAALAERKTRRRSFWMSKHRTEYSTREEAETAFGQYEIERLVKIPRYLAEGFSCAQDRWNYNNSDRIRAASKAWRDRNRSRVLERVRKYYAANRDIMRAYHKRWDFVNHARQLTGISKAEAEAAYQLYTKERRCLNEAERQLAEIQRLARNPKKLAKHRAAKKLSTQV